MKIAILLCGLIFLFCLVMTLVVFPVYSIIKCATNEQLTGGKKTFWVIFVILGGWIGWFAYLIKYPAGKFHKMLGYISIFMMLMFGGALIATNGYLKKESLKTLTKVQTNQEWATNLSPDQIQTLNDSFQTLNNEIQNLSAWRVNRLQVSLGLISTAETYLKDGQFTPNEYEVWMDFYNRRETISEHELRKIRRNSKSLD